MTESVPATSHRRRRHVTDPLAKLKPNERLALEKKLEDFASDSY